MKDALSGRIDMIVTKSVSRFARNLIDCISWVRRLKEQDPPIPVLFEQENLNTLDSTSNIILFVLAMVAEEESHMKSEAMLLSLEWRFSRGRFMTPKLLGYDKVEVVENGIHRKKLVINEEQAQTVRLMYYMLLNGSTTAEIAETLTELKGRKSQYLMERDGRGNGHAQRALLRRCACAKDLDARLSRSPLGEEPQQEEQVLPAGASRVHRHPRAVERRAAHSEQPSLRAYRLVHSHARHRLRRAARLYLRQPLLGGL